MGMGATLVQMGWPPPGVSVPLPPLLFPAPQNPEISMMATTNIDGYHPVGAPTCLRKQEVGKPSLNAAQPRQRVVFMMTFGLINHGKAGALGSVPTVNTH